MKLGSIVLDSDNSDMLSDFYQKLLGWTKSCQTVDGEKWFIVSDDNGGGIPLVFQQTTHYERPVWPWTKGRQQQMAHLDFYVNSEDFEKEVGHAISCGAVQSETQFSDGLRVLLDPSGHPFCIIPIPVDFSKE